MSNVYKTHFPYCIQQEDEGCVLVNRGYKPLGFITKDWVTYNQHPVVFSGKGLSSAVAQKLSWRSDADFPVYLYNDGCAPWLSKEHEQAYLKRLSVLGAIKVSDD